MTKTFKKANDAYEYYHDKIIREGVKFGDTKALFNIGFYILDTVQDPRCIEVYINIRKNLKTYFNPNILL